MIYLKRPLTLLVGIIFSIIALSIIFPADPSKPDLITLIKGSGENVKIYKNTVRNYTVRNIKKIDDSGNALIWSLDERFLYYSKPVKDNEQKGAEEIWINDLHGNSEKVNSKIKLYNIRNAKWSPDGTMLCFMSDIEENKVGLYIYDTAKKTINNITPKNIQDLGVTSFDWDDESLYIIMSIDIVKPCIEVYNTKTLKHKRMDINLKSCVNVAFYKDERIIYTDKDISSKYRIYTSDMSGKNIKYITDGQKFILSPDKDKLVILCDINGQEGLWVYDIMTKQKKMITSWPVYNISWLSEELGLLYSNDADCKNKYTYSGSIYYLESNLKSTEISGAIHTIFVSTISGKKIAMTCPNFMEDKKENKGVFIGEIIK